MTIQWANGALSIRGIRFDAPLTLIESGQSFAWTEMGGIYYTVLNGEALSLTPAEEGFTLYPTREEDAEAFVHYFDLVRDYGRLKRMYAAHPPIVCALECLPGLRVLNQPAWETLVSFILSANNHMARIRKLTYLLSTRYGEPAQLGALTFHALPSAQVLSGVPEQALRDLGFGYRAPFLINTARMVRDGFPLEALRSMPYDEAHARLITLRGVGDKVADCVLLFGLGHASAFPVDTWVDRLMRAWFPEMAALKSRAQVQRAARQLLGANAGIVQQFMFHCARCGHMQI